jgi:hypothetical protein
MSIISRPRPPVKPTRRAIPSARPFGEGILLDRGERRMPFTQADLDWAAQTFNGDAADSDATPSDADLDFAAGCAMAQALMDAGFSLF